ncbi:aminodeoxychorismate lyase [Balneatrix alpica]|uniref:aminodeoxychorismate lyase n=1 Tax=Balneatrix alpica TaxID=75684 RepID=UPI002738CC84|nr:aminodeoxychorismate lyase [Balneatrix alpica]
MLFALVNGQPATAISVQERGLAYGDGLFETLKVAAGHLCFWSYHWLRLQQGMQRLGMLIPVDFEDQLLADIRRALASVQEPDLVLKLIITRGAGGRGYLATTDLELTRVVMLSQHKPMERAQRRQGIKVGLCQTALARQPLLAGIKHLNRLEQVLARREWAATDWQEGLVCDTQANLVSGTLSNVFLFLDGRWQTPSIEYAGIAGTRRRWVLERWPVQENQLLAEQFQAVEQGFICNALMGIVPIAELAGRQLLVTEQILSLQAALEKSEQSC